MAGGWQWWWVIRIGYPPSAEQLGLGVSGVVGLWVLRVASFVSILATTWAASRLVNKKQRWLVGVLVMMSPAVAVMWMSYPVKTAMAMVAVMLSVWSGKNIGRWLVVVTVVVAMVAVVNNKILGENLPLASTLSLKAAQAEITERINTEDTILVKTELPLWIRRAGYNKFSLAMKRTANLLWGFWDTESWFFQEIHPLEQKSVILFYWPEVVVLVVSLWVLIARGRKNIRYEWGVLLVMAWISFGLSDSPAFLREAWVIWLIAIVMAEGVGEIFERRLPYLRAGLVGVGVLTVYGFWANQWDLHTRPWFWLDNRPVAYKLFFDSAKKNNYDNYSKVYVTDLIGPAEKYCRYFIGNCNKYL